MIGSDDKRRTVIQVVNSLERAGAERVAIDLASRMDPAEWDVHVVVVRDGALREFVEDAGLALYQTGHDFDLRAVLIILKMAAYFRRVKPDIVHTHLLGSDIVGRLAALLAGVPIIVSTQHDMLPRMWTSNLYKRFTGKLISATVACSSRVAEYCRQTLRVPERRLHQIDNGVDASSFAGPATHMRTPVTFGAVGSLTPVKGHTFLLNAFADVLEGHPGARLLIAGAGSEQGALEDLAVELGIEPQVDFRGAVDDIPAFLQEVDVFVHASLSEGLPMAVLEAMGAAKPCIATDVSVVAEIFEDGRAGVLVPPGDAHALAEAMNRIVADPAAAEAMGLQARERVTKRYTVERTVDQYTKLYRQLLAQRAGARGAQTALKEPTWWRAVRHTLQFALIAIAVFFIGRALVTGVRGADFAALQVRPGYLVLSAGLLTVYYGFFVGGLTLLFRANGYPVKYRDTFKVSFMANLAKYIPGGIWPIAGRVTLASKLRVDQQTALVISVVESAVSVAGGALVVALSQLIGGEVAGSPPRLVMWALVVAVPIAIHPKVFGRLVPMVAGLLKVKVEPLRMGYARSLAIVSYYAFTWLLAGVAFRTLTMAIVGDPGAGVLAYAATYALASIVGLLVLFAPGGVGAREGALFVALTSVLGAPLAAAISVFARLWSTTVELLLSLAAVGMPYSGRREARASGDGETP